MSVTLRIISPKTCKRRFNGCNSKVSHACPLRTS